MQNNDLEQKISVTARHMFIEKGWAETNMSDIAAALGINRPTLHYYFRTKEKLFESVFGGIIRDSVSRIRHILSTDEPIMERIGKIIDSYYDYFIKDPDLPLFILREVQRNADGVIKETFSANMHNLVEEVGNLYASYAREGAIRDVPFVIFLMTFYSLLICPFVSRNLINSPLLNPSSTFGEFLAIWKRHILEQVQELLGI